MPTKNSHNCLKNWLIVIPARLASQRLPRKALHLLHGRPLILHTYANVAPLAAQGAKIVVATDAKEIFTLCKKNSVPVRMTATSHVCGTERCHEVAAASARRYVLNVQGDEPEVTCRDLLALCRQFAECPAAEVMATLVFASSAAHAYHDTNVVKVVADRCDRAMYFSRRPLPYAEENTVPAVFLKHIGVYAYSRAALTRFCATPPSVLEKQEKLEQLRALELGIPIYLCRATRDSKGIDSSADLAHAQSAKVYS